MCLFLRLLHDWIVKYNMKKLSIIIPIYNCEPYLKQCLYSICKQKVSELQIICIDDCSKDNSLQILLEVQKQYRCIQILQNASNLGQAASRNIGLLHAEGEYIMFVDADDYIAENILPKLLLFMDETQVDIAMYDCYMFLDTGFKEKLDCNARIRKNIYVQQKGIQMLCALISNHEMSGIVCGSIYKKKYLNDFSIKFIDRGQHEDVSYIFEALLYAPQATYFHEIVYYYRQRKTSTLHMPNYKKLLTGLIEGFDVMQNTWNEYKTRNGDEKQYEFYINEYLNQIVDLIENRYVNYLAENGGKVDADIFEKMSRFSVLLPNEIYKYFDMDVLAEIKEAHQVIIYGAGYLAKKVYILLEKNGITVDAFCVTSLKENNKQIFSKPIIEYSNKLKVKTIILAVSEKIKNEILKEINFKEKNVFTFKS